MPVLTKACDMCEDRVAKGKMPMCVQHCQAFASVVLHDSELDHKSAVVRADVDRHVFVHVVEHRVGERLPDPRARELVPASGARDPDLHETHYVLQNHVRQGRSRSEILIYRP